MILGRNIRRLSKNHLTLRAFSACSIKPKAKPAVVKLKLSYLPELTVSGKHSFAPRYSFNRTFLTMSATETGVQGVKYDWDFKFTPSELLEKAENVIKMSRAAYDAVAAVKDQDVNFNTIVKALADIDVNYETVRLLLDVPSNVAPDKAIRDASTEADRKLQDFDVEISMRQDILDRIMYFQKHNTEELLPESKRYVERLIKIGKRNGLHLPKETQAELKKIKNRMSELSISFSKNLNEVTTFLEFDDESLVGLTDDFINSLEKLGSGKRKVTLKYPHYFPVARKARNPKTRQLLEKAFNSQCIEENTKILEELVELRQKQADFLGYPTHASFITEMRLAKTATNVKSFLTDLAAKLKDLWAEEKQLLLQYKEDECKKYGYEFDGRINSWDTRYYTNVVEERKYAVDQEKLREYFPLAVVTKGLLEIYQDLLDLKFAEIKDAKVWHPDVKMFSVRDAESSEIIGYFFLDLFPRDGKYGHACMMHLQPGCLAADGARQVSVAAMVANFTKPTQDKPSLLDHDEVVTFFHEFGHVMHQMCSKANYCLFNGTCVERDFVEAPSQMLENWCWEKEPLRRMSGHYKDGSCLPDSMMDKLIASKNACAGYKNLRQIVLGMFDHRMHISSQANTRELYKQISGEYLQLMPQEGTNFAAHFGHLAGGYDAQYYGYMWSEVFCMDMYEARFKKEGIMNKKVGMDYRRCILQPGGSKDGSDMLREFLGRAPTQDAFLRSKGLKG